MAQYLVLVDVDEDVLETVVEAAAGKEGVKGEFGWLEQSGIHLTQIVRYDRLQLESRLSVQTIFKSNK